MTDEEKYRELKLARLERAIATWTEKVAELGAQHDILSARFKRATIMLDSLQQQWEDALKEEG